MCKETRTKDHAVCDIELGNNRSGYTLLAQVWLASVEAEAEDDKIAQVQERNQRESIRQQIKQMKDDNAAY